MKCLVDVNVEQFSRDILLEFAAHKNITRYIDEDIRKTLIKKFGRSLVAKVFDFIDRKEGAKPCQ